eukprot:scaffold220435_cov35-Prasinocladus_malaysianus.AAC.1
MAYKERCNNFSAVLDCVSMTDAVCNAYGRCLSPTVMAPILLQSPEYAASTRPSKNCHTANKSLSSEIFTQDEFG